MYVILIRASTIDVFNNTTAKILGCFEAITLHDNNIAGKMPYYDRFQTTFREKLHLNLLRSAADE